MSALLYCVLRRGQYDMLANDLGPGIRQTWNPSSATHELCDLTPLVNLSGLQSPYLYV